MAEYTPKESLPSIEFFITIPFPVHSFRDAKGRPSHCSGSGRTPLKEDIDLSDEIPKAQCRGSCKGIYQGYIGRIRENHPFRGWQWSNKPLPKKTRLNSV